MIIIAFHLGKFFTIHVHFWSAVVKGQYVHIFLCIIHVMLAITPKIQK